MAKTGLYPFALSPAGLPTSQSIEAKAGAGPIKATLAVPETIGANGWAFVIKDSQGVVQLRAAGRFPPQEGSSYTEFVLAKPGVVDSASPDAALGQIQLPQSETRFFFEVEFPQAATATPYTGSLWVDDNGDSVVDEPERLPFNVSVAGNVAQGTAHLPFWQGLRDFQVDIASDTTNSAVIKGTWNFDLNKPDKLDTAGAPYPVFFGFQPVIGVGIFALPNILEQLKRSVISPEETEGVTWAVRIGPKIEIGEATPTPTVVPSPTPSPTPALVLTVTPQVPGVGGEEGGLAEFWWVAAAAIVVLVIVLSGMWLARRQRRGTQF